MLQTQYKIVHVCTGTYMHTVYAMGVVRDLMLCMYVLARTCMQRKVRHIYAGTYMLLVGITWFNPPYSQHVKTNIGKKFLALVDKCFPKQNELYKIYNRNTLKISYSCMNNIETIIKTHNSSIINKENNKTPDTCNCRKKQECPLPRKCTIQNVIYEAKVTTENDEKRYLGLTATPFKTRYSSHKSSFNNRNKSNQTELSKHI